jgi:hypothetical protein
VRYIDAPILRDENTDDDGLCDDGRLHYANDANMNVTAVLDTDRTVLERYAYTPYGKPSFLRSSADTLLLFHTSLPAPTLERGTKAGSRFKVRSAPARGRRPDVVRCGLPFNQKSKSA